MQTATMRLKTLHDNWEANILSSLREEESLPALDEGDEEPQTSQVMEVKRAADYLSGLRDFAAAHDMPDLLALISKSHSIEEETKKTKQTKITAFLYYSVILS